jgi:DNA-binding NarL/FixJ family response regulator
VDECKRAALLDRLERHYARFEQDARTIDSRSGDPLSAAAKPRPDEPQELTPRELGVLELVAEGYTDREIAASLHIGDQTVKSHLRRAMAKLQARNRTHAVIVALRLRFIQLHPAADRHAAS